MMGDVSDITEGRASKTKPQKNAGDSSAVSVDDLTSDDDVVALTALRTKLAEMLAKADIHERDAKSVSLEFRAVRIALQEAKDLAASAKIGQGGGLRAVGGRSFDGDI